MTFNHSSVKMGSIGAKLTDCCLSGVDGAKHGMGGVYHIMGGAKRIVGWERITVFCHLESSIVHVMISKLEIHTGFSCSVTAMIFNF